MKRYKYIGLLLLAGLAGACQKETVAPAGAGYSTEAILFTTPYTVSKSAAMRDGHFEIGDKVGVLGYCRSEYQGRDYSASDWDTKKFAATPDVFYNQELTYEDDGVLSYNYSGDNAVGTLRGWYNEPDYTYAFFAYYPYVDVNDYYQGTITAEDGETSMGTIRLSNEGDTGDPTFTYTMPYRSNSSTSTLLNLDRVPDVMLAYTVNHRHSDGAVSLKFRHMLCAFEFEINNYNEEPVEITSLVFRGENFYKSFTITGQKQDYTPNDDRYSGQFQLLSEGKPLVCPPALETDGVIVPGKAIVSLDGSDDPIDLLFIPDADGKITAGICSVSVQMEGERERTQNVRDGMSFRPGTRSIFSINIVGDNFVIEVRADNAWSDGGDSNIYFD